MSRRASILLQAVVGLAVAMLPGCGLWNAIFSHTACKQLRLSLEVEAGNDLNEDEEGVPRPVEISVYGLKHAEIFEQVSADALRSDAKAALGADFLSAETFTVFPGAALGARKLEVPAGAAALGIAGVFRKSIRGQWRKVVGLESAMEDCREGDEPIPMKIRVEEYRIIAPEKAQRER